MNRLITFVAIACASVLIATTVRAQTVDSLKAELAAKKDDVAKLERRIRRMEVQSGAAAACSRPPNQAAASGCCSRPRLPCSWPRTSPVRRIGGTTY